MPVLHVSFASGKSDIFLPQSGQKRKSAGLIEYETVHTSKPLPLRLSARMFSLMKNGLNQAACF
ncbi:MAG: hypothetical protein R6U55_13850 [Desulfovermiculus sp.]